jgi:hypothetical protein
MITTNNVEKRGEKQKSSRPLSLVAVRGMRILLSNRDVPNTLQTYLTNGGWSAHWCINERCHITYMHLYELSYVIMLYEVSYVGDVRAEDRIG